MHPPGYYATNYRALRLRELVRMFGLLRLPFTYFSSRSMTPSNPSWMPGLWADNECKQDDMSARFWQITAAYREEFRRLGFSECGFSKVTRYLSPTFRENGGISYLDESRSHFALLLYTKVHAPAPINADREQITIAFTVAFDGGSLSYTNSKNAFDPLPHQRVVRLSAAGPEALYRRLRQNIARNPNQPRQFPDLATLKKWFDERQDEVFQERAERWLFLRLSDDQVEAVRHRLPPRLEQ